MSSYGDDLALALELADLADGITLERFEAADLSVESKPDMTPVSDADLACEEALRERLTDARPADTVLGEEFGGRDHSTVVYAVQQVEKNMKKDSKTKAMVEDIIKNIRDR